MTDNMSYPRPRHNKKLLERQVNRQSLETISVHYNELKRELCEDCRCHGGVNAEDVLHDAIERVIRENYKPDEVVDKVRERFKMGTYQNIHDNRSKLKHNRYANDIQTEEE